MKKNIRIIAGLNLACSTITMMFFAYRYIWFAIETVPSERVASVAVLIVINGIAYGATFLD